MPISYTSLHWGTGPRAQLAHRVPHSQPASPVGELVAISYATRKADEREIYRHAFELEGGRGPYLLKLDDEGDYIIGPPPPARLIAIGRVVDLELADGGLPILLPGAWVATDPDGERVYITGPTGPEVAIEHRDGPRVVDAGIVG